MAGIQSQLAFAPYALAAYAGPLSRIEVRDELGQPAFVARLPNESADAMHLSRAATSAGHVHLAQIAAGHPDGPGSFADSAIIDVKGAWPVERSKGSHSIARPGEQDVELRPFH